MAYSEDTRIALIVGPIWLIGLAVVYYMKGFHKVDETPNSKLVSKTSLPYYLKGYFYAYINISQQISRYFYKFLIFLCFPSLFLQKNKLHY